MTIPHPRLETSTITKPAVLFGIVLLGLLVLASGASGTEFRGGDAVHIGQEEILDDLFIAGGDISVRAHIIGDLFCVGATVSAGDSAIIENSFMAAGRRVDVNGTIYNSVRAFGQDINVRGHIERNLIAIGGTLIIDNLGWIEKDLTIYGGEAIIRGRIDGGINGAVGEAVISGQIDGDVVLEADEITVLPSAIISGKLKYESDKEAKVEEGAQIFEGVERITPDEPTEGGYSFGSFLWDAWWYLASVVVGVVLLILFRSFVLDTKRTMLESSLPSLGIGFLFLVCLPVAAIVLAITLLGVPLAALTVLCWIILLYVAKIFVGLAVGEWLLTRLRGGRTPRSFPSLLVGLLLLTFVTLIPYIGFLIKVMIVSLGFGAFFITAYRYRTAPPAVIQ
jgi:cytoskeletal protein CcmA (bactofilin family)